MLVAVVGVVGAIGFTDATGRAGWVGMQVAHGVVASDEFLVQAGVFVVHTRIDHGDVHVLPGKAEVPCAYGIEGGVARLDRRRLNVAVEDDVAVALHHHDIVKGGELEGQRSVNLAEQNGINGFDDINHAEVHRCKVGQMPLVDLDAVGKANAGRADVGFQTVVDGVSVLIERRSLPPRRGVAQPSGLGLLGNIKTVAGGHPLQSFGVDGFPADRLGFHKQGAGDRTHQQRKYNNSQHSTHVLPQPPRASCSAST